MWRALRNAEESSQAAAQMADGELDFATWLYPCSPKSYAQGLLPVVEQTSAKNEAGETRGWLPTKREILTTFPRPKMNRRVNQTNIVTYTNRSPRVAGIREDS